MSWCIIVASMVRLSSSMLASAWPENSASATTTITTTMPTAMQETMIHLRFLWLRLRVSGFLEDITVPPSDPVAETIAS